MAYTLLWIYFVAAGLCVAYEFGRDRAGKP
jgi:hypothetical protein